MASIARVLTQLKRPEYEFSNKNLFAKIQKNHFEKNHGVFCAINHMDI